MTNRENGVSQEMALPNRILSYAKIVFFDNREYQKLYYCFHFFIFFAFLFYGVCDVAVWTVAGVDNNGKS